MHKQKSQVKQPKIKAYFKTSQPWPKVTPFYGKRNALITAYFDEVFAYE